jgi:hypothetical protein
MPAKADLFPAALFGLPHYVPAFSISMRPFTSIFVASSISVRQICMKNDWAEIRFLSYRCGKLRRGHFDANLLLLFRLRRQNPLSLRIFRAVPYG